MIKQFRWALLLSAVALAAAGLIGGPTTLAVVAVLAVLEISLSFDNAVVNAKVLTRMHPTWQKLFLTVGILIAVFGMRLVFPLVIVSLTASLSPSEVIHLALNDATRYGEELEAAKHTIYAFGGTFLLMIFLDFVFDPERDVFWIRPVELVLARIGRINAASVFVALLTVVGVASGIGQGEKVSVLTSGSLGLLTYLAVNGLDSLFEGSMESREGADATGARGAGAFTGAAFRAGFFAFLYLEVLDASFSFDGVIGAFAISDEIFVIAVGLGIGAFWIRSMTIYLVRQGTLSEYPYLDHGAHWAIGALAAIMMIGITGVEVPEVVTGLLGVGFIAAALASSIRERRRDPGLTEQEPIEEVADVEVTLPTGVR